MTDELIAEAVSWMRADNKYPRAEANDLIQRLTIALDAAGDHITEAEMQEAWKHRTVTTVAELDALPVDTVIKAATGAVLHRQRAELWTPCDDTKDQFYTAGVAECFRGPFTVLWVGGTE